MLDEVDLSPRDRALYSKLHASHEDIGIARNCANFIQKKAWHSFAIARRGSIPIQQISFTTTMIVAYARPFSPGRSKSNFPQRLLQYQPEERALHQRLLRLRNEEYAHSDMSSYKVTPLKGAITCISSIRRVWVSAFSSKEIALFLTMTDALLNRISARMEEIRVSGS